MYFYVYSRLRAGIFTLTLLNVSSKHFYCTAIWMDLSVAALAGRYMKCTGSRHVYSFMCYADVVVGKRNDKEESLFLLLVESGNYCSSNWHGKFSYLLYTYRAMDHCIKVVEENYMAVNLCNWFHLSSHCKLYHTICCIIQCRKTS